MTTNVTQRLFVALQACAVVGLYVFVAWWGLGVGAVNTFAAPLWPPTGIAIAALFLLGHRLWPAIAVGAFLVNFAVGAPALAALGIAIGNTMEAVMAVYLLRNFRFNPLFDRLADSFGFIIVALSVPLISAIIGPVSLALFGVIPPASLPEMSFTWWIGDILGALIVAPLLIRWLSNPIARSSRTIPQILENIAFFCVLIVVALLVFLDPIPGLREFTLPYMVFVPLTWGALRVGPRMMTMAIATTAMIATYGTLMGMGPFANSSGGINDLFLLQVFLATVATIFLLFVSAVEDRKNAARRLEADVAELSEDVLTISEADRAKNDFIATLSHELRNPLAPILSTLEIIKATKPHNGELLTLVDSTHQNVMRITRLLDDLLDVARISRKKFTLQKEHVSLKDVIEHSVAMADPLIKQRGHSFSLNTTNEKALLYADPLRIEQVIVNLLNNAAKYTPHGGSITLAARTIGSEAEIRVRDNGIGIPTNELTEIFEPFKQLNQGRRTESAGLGIGLSLAQRLVELHGGTIRVESAGKDRGSEFIVRLPLAAEVMLLSAGKEIEKIEKPVAPAAEPPAPPPSPRKTKRTILIVDDNQKAADALATLLNHSGHEARTAFDGAQALAALENFRPDVVFLDIGLPDKDGYEVATMIRSYLDPSPSIVALTGYGQEEDHRKTLEAGFDGHLVKPVSIAELERVLARS